MNLYLYLVENPPLLMLAVVLTGMVVAAKS
jgi:hypothetical protein